MLSLGTSGNVHREDRRGLYCPLVNQCGCAHREDASTGKTIAHEVAMFLTGNQKRNKLRAYPKQKSPLITAVPGYA